MSKESKVYSIESADTYPLQAIAEDRGGTTRITVSLPQTKKTLYALEYSGDNEYLTVETEGDRPKHIISFSTLVQLMDLLPILNHYHRGQIYDNPRIYEAKPIESFNEVKEKHNKIRKFVVEYGMEHDND